MGIQEQNIQLITTGTCPNPTGGTAFPAPCYQTALFQTQLNVDSTPPAISTITISPSAVYGQPSTATFTCTDPTAANGAPASGINPTNGCVGGPNSQASGVSGNVDTSSAGPKTFTVTATDLAGNVTTSSLPYTVAQAPATAVFSSLTQTYTGAALSPTLTTTPSGLSFTLSGAPQTNAGSYPVTANITDPNYTGSASGTFVISPAAATVSLSGLAQIYTGSPLVATATTNPASLAVSFTYNGSSTPPTNAGSYAVVATITNPNYTGTASGTLVISPAAGTIAFSNLAQIYTGGALSPTVTTTPSGLSYTLTGAPDTNSGSYAVSATITNPNYTGTASGTFVIARAAATVTFSNLTQAYTGSALSPTVTTTPSGLSHTLTGAPDTNAGSYAVTATVTNPNYSGTASGTFVITQPAASVSPSSVNFGTVKSGTVVSQNVTLKNTGTGTMTINSIKLGASSDSDEFSTTNNCGSSLAAGASCNIVVSYHSDRDDGNGVTGKLVITDNAPGSPQTVPLSGKIK